MDQFFNLFAYALLFLTLYFEVFLLTTYLEDSEKFKAAPLAPRMPGRYPHTTIIVPAWNEAETLSATVQSLLALDYPKERLRVIIVDDGSTDHTLSVAKRFCSFPRVQVLSKENGGKYTALNLALRHTNSELVGCLDADSFVARDALREMIPYFDDPKVMAVTPSVQTQTPRNLIERIQAAEYMVGQFTRKIFSRLNGLYVTPGPFSIYRRSVFLRIGDFVEGYQTEDMEMALRMQSHRMKIENAHGALVYTVSPKNFAGLYRQRVRWVSGFLKNAFFKYRFMLFNRRYGNLGLLTMPFAVGSIFIALFFSGLYVKNILAFIHGKYVAFSALGFHPSLGWTGFDWFSMNVEFRRLIIYLLFFVTVFLILSGGRMVTRRFHISRDMFYFVLFYGLIAPFWLLRSLYNLLAAKEARWR